MLFQYIYLPTVKGLSQSTIVSYKATFRILMEFLYTVKGIPADMVEFGTLDDKLIMEFLSWLETERSYSVSTRNQRLSAIAAFSIYAQNRDFGSAVISRNCVLKVPKKKELGTYSSILTGPVSTYMVKVKRYAV